MMHLKSKKGLSDVVATVLIVLLAIAAIVIVWGFVSPFIKGTTNQADIQSKCLTAEVVPVSCTTAGVVNVQWKAGEATKVIAIATLSDGSVVPVEGALPSAQLGSTPVTIPNLGTKTVASAKAAAMVSDGKGGNAKCSESFESVTCQ